MDCSPVSRSRGRSRMKLRLLANRAPSAVSACPSSSFSFHPLHPRQATPHRRDSSIEALDIVLCTQSARTVSQRVYSSWTHPPSFPSQHTLPARTQPFHQSFLFCTASIRTCRTVEVSVGRAPRRAAMYLLHHRWAPLRRQERLPHFPRLPYSLDPSQAIIEDLSSTRPPFRDTQML